MVRPPRFHVLLVSQVPQAHTTLLDSFRRNGAVVSVASSPEETLALLRRPQELVLVDLALGAGLTRDVVAALNAGRGPAVVVALHDGRLEDAAHEASNLSVDGFCRALDLLPHARFAAGAAAAQGHWLN